jgi:hypothetical protein
MLADHTTADVPNPGVTPQSIDGEQLAARYVRVTATKLAPRLPTDFIFALGELSVFTAEGTNVAASAAVTSLDSIEAPARWRRANLVDGHYYGRAGVSKAELERLHKEREGVLVRLLTAEERRELDRLSAAIAMAEQALQQLPPQQLVYAGTAFRGEGNFAGTGGQPRSIYLLERGSVTQPGDEVEPGALACLPHAFAIARTKPGTGESQVDEGLRRAALAAWIAHQSNPLTWRSITNRVWQYHFGRGIVDTPNDFGRMGSRPTHPELLDWLAIDLRDGDQSLKRLHRRIVTSHAYRQTSAAPSPQSLALSPSSVDSDNRLLWRANRRRLEAEALRDAVLQVAGVLDGRMDGPSFQDFVIEHPEHSPHYEYHLHDPDDPRSHRRSIYRFIVRSQPQPFMTTLDCADPSQRVDKRNESLSALQALTTLNNGFMVVMSRRWAERLARHSDDQSDQVAQAVLEAFGRPATADEQQSLAAYAAEHGLANLCRVLFNANEFSFVD